MSQLQSHDNVAADKVGPKLHASPEEGKKKREGSERIGKRVNVAPLADGNRSMIRVGRQLHGPFCSTDPFSRRKPIPLEQVKQNIPRKSAVKRSVPRASGAFIRPLFPFTVNPLFPDFRVPRRTCDKQIDAEISLGDSMTTGAVRQRRVPCTNRPERNRGGRGVRSLP